MRRRRLFARLVMRSELRKARANRDQEAVSILRDAIRDNDVLDAAVVELERLVGRKNVKRALGDGTLFKLFIDNIPAILEFIKTLFGLIGGLT